MSLAPSNRNVNFQSKQTGHVIRMSRANVKSVFMKVLICLKNHLMTASEQSSPFRSILEVMGTQLPTDAQLRSRTFPPPAVNAPLARSLIHAPGGRMADLLVPSDRMGRGEMMEGLSLMTSLWSLGDTDETMRLEATSDVADEDSYT